MDPRPNHDRLDAPMTMLVATALALLLAACGAGGDESGVPGETVAVDVADTNLEVTVLEVLDPAEDSDGETGEGRFAFVAVEIAIANTGDAVYESQSPLRNATLIDVDDLSYSNAFADIPDCPLFGIGSFSLAPGEVAIGCVPFLPPEDAELVTFEFRPDGEAGDTTARVDIEGYTTGDAPGRDDLRSQATS